MLALTSGLKEWCVPGGSSSVLEQETRRRLGRLRDTKSAWEPSAGTHPEFNIDTDAASGHINRYVCMHKFPYNCYSLPLSAEED